MKRTAVLVTFVLGIAALPASSQAPGALERLQSEKIRAHMTFLADDLLEGRGTGTSAFEIAAKYVAAQFAAAGLQPAGTGGTYYQRVRFRKTKIVPEQTRFAVTQSGAPQQPLEWDRVRSVLAMGAANSTLGIAVNEAARQLGLGVEPATAPLNYSDHFPFVMKGVPSLWIVGAGSSEQRTDATEAAQRSIHKPTDDMNRTFQWDAAVTFARLNFLIGHEVANQSERPVEPKRHPGREIRSVAGEVSEPGPKRGGL